MFVRSPFLGIYELPDGEQESARYISNNLEELSRSVEQLSHAIALFLVNIDKSAFLDRRSKEYQAAFSREQAWRFIGARHGVLVIYGFFMITQAINHLLKGCPTIRELLDVSQKRRAQQDFLKAFPTIAKLRRFAAHPGETALHPDKVRTDQLSAPFELSGISKGNLGGIHLDGVLIDDGYVSTVQGQIVSYQPSLETIQILSSIRNSWFSTFMPVEQSLRDRL